jgi:hypothetical protein
MHTRPTVDMRWILIGEEEHLHVGFYVVVAAVVSSAESSPGALCGGRFHTFSNVALSTATPAHPLHGALCLQSRHKEYR